MTRESLIPNSAAAYFRAFLTGIQNTFVYRWNFLLRTVFGIVPLVGMIYLWRAVTEGGGGKLGNYGFSDMIFYFALVVFIERRTEFHADAMAATQTSDNTTSQSLLSTLDGLLAEIGVSENVRAPAALHYLNEVITAQASARGFSDGFLMIAVVFVLAVIPAWNLGKARRRGPARRERVSER